MVRLVLALVSHGDQAGCSEALICSRLESMGFAIELAEIAHPRFELAGTGGSVHVRAFRVDQLIGQAIGASGRELMPEYKRRGDER